MAKFHTTLTGQQWVKFNAGELELANALSDVGNLDFTDAKRMLAGRISEAQEALKTSTPVEIACDWTLRHLVGVKDNQMDAVTGALKARGGDYAQQVSQVSWLTIEKMVKDGLVPVGVCEEEAA